MRQTKSFPVRSLKVLDAEKGTFEALVSVFGNVDYAKERVISGAFSKTLDRWEASGDPIPVIWSHDWENPFAHIGKAASASQTTDGLLVTGELDLDKPFAKQVFDLMKERRVKEFSFAYDVLDSARAKDGALDLLELDLIEVGPCLKGMNPATQLVTVKAMARELAGRERAAKAAIPAKSTATSDDAWDGPANEARLPDDTTEADLRAAFAWVDPAGDATAKSSYKFIHHFVDADGKVGAASTRACSTGIAVLNGGRGGTDIDDKEGVHAHLAKHLEDAGMDAPALKGAKPKQGKARSATGAKAYVTLEGSYEDLMADLDEALEDLFVQQAGWAWLEATYDSYVIAGVYAWYEDEATYYQVPYSLDAGGAITLGAPVEVEITADFAPVKSRSALAKARGRKEGRRNSMTDQQRIQSVHDLSVDLGAQCDPEEGDDGAKSKGKAQAEDPATRSLLLDLDLLELEVR